MLKKISLLILLILSGFFLISCDSEDSNIIIDEEVSTEDDNSNQDSYLIEPKIWEKGTGSEKDPYQIETIEHLAYLSQTVNDLENPKKYKHTSFILVNDLDLMGKKFIPIGRQSNSSESHGSGYFWGDFNGNNHIISNLDINLPSQTHVGLFGLVYFGKIENLGVVKSKIIGNEKVGGIVGFSYDSKIESCFFEGVVKGNRIVGGITGELYIESGLNNLKNCFTKGEVVASISSAGGITGTLSGRNILLISSCFNESKVYSNKYAGGIAGKHFRGGISGCYNKGDITGESTISGISGISSYGYISRCYSLGTITGSLNTRPIAIDIISEISNCYYLKGSIIEGLYSFKAREMEENQLKSIETIDLLNYHPNVGSKDLWKYDSNNVNEGYPILLWQ